MLGFFLTVVGWLFFVKATDLGEVSIVQPLMSVGDIFVVLLAITFLHERLGRVDGLAWRSLSSVPYCLPSRRRDLLSSKSRLHGRGSSPS